MSGGRVVHYAGPCFVCDFDFSHHSLTPSNHAFRLSARGTRRALLITIEPALLVPATLLADARRLLEPGAPAPLWAKQHHSPLSTIQDDAELVAGIPPPRPWGPDAVLAWRLFQR